MPSSIDYPQLIQKPFCDSGAKNTIPVGTASPLASFDDGFPPATMTPISSGGVPPEGKDMNGILWAVTQFQAWANVGGRFKFDATLAGLIGGYPAGVVLQSNDLSQQWINLTEGNSVDPNGAGDPLSNGWAPYSGLGAGGNLMGLADAGAANAYAVVPPTFTVSKSTKGLLVGFIAAHANTTASTLKFGTSTALNLLRNDGVAVQSGDIVAGTHYFAFCLGTAWVLLGTMPSQRARAGGIVTGQSAGAFTNTSLRMAGFGLSITPKSSGMLVVDWAGAATSSSASGYNYNLSISYGTGSAPSFNAAATGTQLPGNYLLSGDNVAAGRASVSNGFITGLAVGTPYWIDLAVGVHAGGNDVSFDHGCLRAFEL